MNLNILINLKKKIELDLLTGCWIWKASKNRDGYGQFWNGYKVVKAHRLSYEHWNGIISNEHEIDHLCRNPSCVNPQHLEAVSHKINMQRSPVLGKHDNHNPHNSHKTHCKRGHEYNEENTYIHKNRRHCKTCRRNLQRITN